MHPARTSRIRAWTGQYRLLRAVPHPYPSVPTLPPILILRNARRNQRAVGSALGHGTSSRAPAPEPHQPQHRCRHRRHGVHGRRGSRCRVFRLRPHIVSSHTPGWRRQWQAIIGIQCMSSVDFQGSYCSFRLLSYRWEAPNIIVSRG